MVIDAGQKWHHKHNRQLVEVLAASNGTVAFRRRDSRIEWSVSQFLVWYQQAKRQPKQEHRDLPKAGELWYSTDYQESCVIEEIQDGDNVIYKYATEQHKKQMRAWWFCQIHSRVRESQTSKPQYDPASVAFPERFKQSLDNAVSAGQSIRRAAQTVKQARKVAEAAIAATGAVVAKADLIDDLKTRAVDVLAECHQVSQDLREALDRLEAA